MYHYVILHTDLKGVDRLLAITGFDKHTAGKAGRAPTYNNSTSPLYIDIKINDYVPRSGGGVGATGGVGTVGSGIIITPAITIEIEKSNMDNNNCT